MTVPTSFFPTILPPFPSSHSLPAPTPCALTWSLPHGRSPDAVGRACSDARKGYIVPRAARLAASVPWLGLHGAPRAGDCSCPCYASFSRVPPPFFSRSLSAMTMKPTQPSGTGATTATGTMNSTFDTQVSEGEGAWCKGTSFLDVSERGLWMPQSGEHPIKWASTLLFSGKMPWLLITPFLSSCRKHAEGGTASGSFSL